MNVHIETVGETTLLALSGRLDFGASAGFQAAIEELFAATRRGGVIIDCAELDYVSSAGLRVFLLGAKGAQRTGRALALCALKPAVREVFDLSGFSRILVVHADRAAALTAVSGTRA